jgi:hypothetical protein
MPETCTESAHDHETDVRFAAVTIFGRVFLPRSSDMVRRAGRDCFVSGNNYDGILSVAIVCDKPA